MAPKDNFRARRLSVSDIDTSEFDAQKAAGGASSTPASTRKAKRMSMSPEMGAKLAKETLPFPPEIVGTFSCHGVEPGQREGETMAKINQDRGCMVYPFACDGQDYQQAVFCVYDGHGSQGDKVSQFIATKVNELLEQKLLENPSADPAEVFKYAYVEADTQLRKDKNIDAELSGTTAVSVLYRFHANQSATIWCAWAGDSRAVVACADASDDPSKTVYVDLSDDHKPNTPKEMDRITKAGGFVSPPEEEWGGPARVWIDANMTLPGLAMARSIGDHLVKSVGVTAEPEVKRCSWPPQPDDSMQLPGVPLFCTLASDGVWEFIESDKAIQLVQKFYKCKKDSVKGDCDATLAVTKLVETAAAKWRQEEGDYRDDITAFVARLGPNLFVS